MWVSASLVGCVSGRFEPASAPVADAVVLLAQISPYAVTVDGVLDGVTQHVDLDGAPDDRYGFRYRVVDGDGDVLAERSTLGPVIVESFLEYWSEEAGVDLLQSLPTLGRFAIQVPLIEGAESVLFEVRDENGDYQLRGRWDYEDLDEPRVVPGDWAVQTRTLHEGGPPERSLDVVIVGDGYRFEELDLFREHADAVTEELLGTEPFTTYADRINVVRVDVPSAESGASYDTPDRSYVANTFGSIFAVELVNRVSGSTYNSRAIFQAEQWRVAEAISHVPWDAVLVLVNSPGYGGMAVHFATVTTGVSDYAPTGVHELGHAFGMLGDEYVYDDCVRSASVGIPENIAEDPENPPWGAWIDADVPLPTPDGEGYGVGAYEGAWNCADLYRPAHECKMREDVEGPFCDVCTELLTRRLYRFFDPVRDARLDGHHLVLDEADAGALVRVLRDGELVSEGTVEDLPRIPGGGDTLRIEVDATSGFVRDDPHHDLVGAFDLVRAE